MPQYAILLDFKMGKLHYALNKGGVFLTVSAMIFVIIALPLKIGYTSLSESFPEVVLTAVVP